MRSLSRRSLLASAAALPALGARPGDRVKLAVTTDEVDDDLAIALDFIQKFDLRHAEIRNLWGRYNTELPLERIREARRMLEDAGVKLAILDTGFFKTPLPAADAAGRQALEEQWALLERAFERADILGSGLVRTFAFMRPNHGPAPADASARIAELTAESARRAKAAGLRLALENVGGSYISTADEAAQLLAKIADPTLGLTWDPNNSARSGDPEPFPAGYRELDASRIYHVHLRDYRRTPDGGAEWCGVGEGEFDHVGQIRALLADGYDGVFSLETHFKIDGSKAKASEFSMRHLIERVRQV